MNIYLDNNASTFLDPRVAAVIRKEIEDPSANPSSVHRAGMKAKAKLLEAKRTIAGYLGVKPQEIIFTSGATEGANLVIRGLFDDFRGHVITSAVEHVCVKATIKALEAKGVQATYLNPGEWGAVQPKAVLDAIRPDTRLIALMAVNNETGVKTDIDAVASIAAKAGIPLFVDGVALLGKEPFSINPGVKAMCFSGHKLHAPKGIGFVFVRSGLKMAPQITGGEQEMGRRGGTENLIGIIALAEAVRILKEELPQASKKMETLRDRLERSLISRLPNIAVNGKGPRVVNTTNLAFHGMDAEELRLLMDREGIAVSHGSACQSGALEPSHVLLGMGFNLASARSSIRFSLSRMTEEAEIDACVDSIIRICHKL